jgi:hypothetical protein
VATYNIWEFAFNSQNDLFLITSLGVYNSKTEMFYWTNKFKSQIFLFRPYSLKPVCFYIDDADNLWMATNSRMGCDIQVFSTRTNTFTTFKKKGIKRLSDIGSIFGFRKTIFFTQGDINGMSDVFSYYKGTMRRLVHKEYDTATIGPPKDQEEYISAGTFDEINKELYYYSNKGMFKARYNSKKNELENLKRIIPPQYVWTNDQPDRFGFALWVNKIFVYDKCVIYLNMNEGIFVFKDGILYNLK